MNTGLYIALCFVFGVVVGPALIWGAFWALAVFAALAGVLP